MFRLLTFLFFAARGREVRSFTRLSKRLTLTCFAQKGIARIQTNILIAGNYVAHRQYTMRFKGK